MSILTCVMAKKNEKAYPGGPVSSDFFHDILSKWIIQKNLKGVAPIKMMSHSLFLFKNYLRTTIWTSTSTLVHIPRENHNLKRYMYPNVHCSSIYNSQDMEATSMSINKGMDKEDVVHIYNRILYSHRKEWNNAICSNMRGHGDYHTKWSKSDRESQI